MPVAAHDSGPMTDPSEPSSSADRMFASLIKSNDPLGLFTTSDCDSLGNAIEDTLIPLPFPPLEASPCANLCPNPGRLPCGRCKLVSYCSQVGPDWSARPQSLNEDALKRCEREYKSVHKRSVYILTVRPEVDWLQIAMSPLSRPVSRILALVTMGSIPRGRLPRVKRPQRGFYRCSHRLRRD